MKKFLTKLFAAAIAATCAFSAMAGCGGAGADPNTLTIRAANTGFNLNCITAIAKEFARIEKCKVKIESTAIMDQDLNKLINNYEMEDIFFISGTNKAPDVIRQKKFLEIDDVWNSVPDGEDKPIKDKVFATFRDDSYKYDGHYYSLPYEIQLGGIAYNKTTLDEVYGEGKWTLPRTSDEFTAMAKDVTSRGAWGVTFTTSQPYWTLAIKTWAVQYHGVEEYTRLASGYYKKADGTWEFSQNGECLDQTIGQLRTYEAVYNVMNKQQGICSTFCDAMDFAQMQTSFAGLGYKPADEKKVAFTPTGAWLFEENNEDFAYAGTTPGFFNVVLSAAVERLSFYEEKGTDYYSLSAAKRKAYDGALSELIEYADKVKAGEEVAVPTTAGGFDVTADDVAAVSEMRSLRHVDSQPNVGIAHNSKKVELAKKFLTFYASDYAGEIYAANCHGVTPFCYDKREITPETPLFDREVSEMLSGGVNLIPSFSRKPYGSLNWFSEEGYFYTNEDASKERYNTPEKAFNGFFKALNKSNWKEIVRKSGNADKLVN